MGGENSASDADSARRAGSSPRGRGKRGARARGNLRPRLIPAWAGKTMGDRRGASPEPAHPRVGGENLVDAAAGSSDAGSSPRGRGKLFHAFDEFPSARLIPAWAGKTSARRRCARRRWAHPRVGGENRVACLPSLATTGSSPRGRGKLEEGELSALITRLIPAWAGKTPPRAARWQGMMAHPRVGGENRMRRSPSRE